MLMEAVPITGGMIFQVMDGAEIPPPSRKGPPRRSSKSRAGRRKAKAKSGRPGGRRGAGRPR